MNIIYLHTHDTGRVISPYGYGVNTPNYQRIFENSLMFQNAFAVAPTCSPSRAGLLTGCYPHQNGMLGLAQRGFSLDLSLHIVRYLKQHHYLTVLAGVQHEYAYYLDHDVAANAIGYDIDLSSDHKKYIEEDLIYWDIENKNNVCTWLRNHDSKKPFFLSYGQHATHRKFPSKIAENIDEDYTVPPTYIPNNRTTRTDFAQYQTSLQIADQNIGEIYDCLKELGYLNNTIIIVTTDHGIAYPFNKCTLFDRGIGVLLAMSVPNSKQTAKTYDGLISHIDVFPTLCELLHLDPPKHLEGKSFAKLFQGDSYEGDEFIFAENNFHTSYEPYRAIRNQRYKYIEYFDSYEKLNLSNIDNSIVKEFYEQYELRERKKDKIYLFDLIYDPNEQNNLATRHNMQNILHMMQSKLREIMKRTNDPLLQGPLPIKKGIKVNKAECYSPSSKDPNDYWSVE